MSFQLIHIWRIGTNNCILVTHNFSLFLQAVPSVEVYHSSQAVEKGLSVLHFSRHCLNILQIPCNLSSQSSVTFRFPVPLYASTKYSPILFCSLSVVKPLHANLSIELLSSTTASLLDIPFVNASMIITACLHHYCKICQLICTLINIHTERLFSTMLNLHLCLNITSR